MSAPIPDVVRALQKRPYVQVPFDISHAQIDAAVQAFFKFLEEPDAVKEHIDFKIAKAHRRGDVGFKHRDPGEDIYNDSKDFFHFHPDIFDHYAPFIAANPVVADFLKKAAAIWDLAYAKTHDLLTAFDQKFPGTSAKIFDTPQPHILLRFLKYNWQESGEYLAKPHFDAGSFTLAIAESGPGLRIGTGPDDLELVHHAEGHAIFMVSSNFQKVIETETLSPGWHDVIQLDQTLIGKPFARWAVVAFIEAHGVDALPRTETHKWYQNEA